MAPRQRKPINAPLRPGMRVRDGYYSWRHPETGEEFGLGRNRTKAIEEVIAAEIHLASKRLSLVQRITGGGNTWADWCDEFEKIVFGRDSADNTLRTRKSQLKRLRTCFPANTAVTSIDTKACADVVKALSDAGKHRSAQAFRSFLMDCFDRMVARGWRKDNPARVLDTVTVKVRRARLSFEVFKRVYDTTQRAWLRNAMALALVTGQDRVTCREAKFSDFHDGGWWMERSKTGARIFLPLELRLDCFGMSLDDVLRQCRSTGIVSRYLVHQTQRVKGAVLGKPLNIAMITRVFSAELAQLGIDWGDKSPPTFHEIRSLSGRLYRAQGNVNPQELLGHKDPRTTAIYTDGRGEWVKVSVRK